MASISYTKGYFRTVMMLNFHAFEYSSGIAPSKVKKKNPNDLKLAHDMEWCHVPFAYQNAVSELWGESEEGLINLALIDWDKKAYAKSYIVDTSLKCAE